MSLVIASLALLVRHLKAGKSLRDVAARCEVAINTVRKVKRAMAGS